MGAGRYGRRVIAARLWVPGGRVAEQAVRFGLARWLADAALVLLLAWLPWLYFWRLFAPLRADQMTVAESDFTWGQFPLLLTAARALRDGALPIWNPLSSGGQPLLAHPQTSALYPLSWLAFAGMRDIDAGSVLALEAQLPLHLALASVFTYVLARVLIGSRTGALVAALGFAYSGFLTSYPLQQLPILRSAAWFPLQVLAWWLALERRSWQWAALAGVALALALLAGHPQTVFLEIVGLGLVGLAWAYSHPPAGWSLWKLGRAASLGLLAAAVGAGLSAAQWLATRELSALSSRAEEGFNFLAGGFSLWEVPIDLLAPRILGGFPPYVGGLGLVLAVGGVVLRPTRVHAVFIPLAVAGLLLSLGSNTFLFPALYVLVPGFDLFRNQERSILLFSLAMAVLAGAGARALLAPLDLDQVGSLARYRRVLARFLLLALAVGAALSVGHVAAEVAASPTLNRWRETIHGFFFFVFVLACAWGIITARLYLPAAQPALPTLVALLMAFDLFSVTADRQLTVRPADAVYHRPAIVDRVLASIDAHRTVDRNLLGGNHGLIYGIPNLESTFPLRLARLDTARQRLPQARLYDLLDVTHVIAERTDPLLASAGEIETVPDAGYVLFRRADTPGAAFIVPTAQRVASPEEALQVLAEPSFDLRTRALLEVPPAETLPVGGPGWVSEIRRGWTDVFLRTSAPAGGYLVLSQVAYPGWKAWVNGEERPIWQANYLVQAVWLPPGEHIVVFRYEPDSLKLGAALTLATLVLLGLGAVGTIGWLVGRRERRGG